MTTAALISLTRDLAADQNRWRPYARFTDESRWWTPVPGPIGVDIWVLTWWPDARTELHDHGEAAAALTVVQGALHEVQVDRDGRLRTSELALGSSQWVAPRVIHDVVNRGPEPAVSIHAYSPRLAEMNYWQLDKRGLRAVRTVAA